jgi:hypothetical protein
VVRSGSALAAAALVLGTQGAAAMDRTILLFGGFATLNDFGEVLAVAPIDSAETGLVGVAPGLSWDLPDPRFKFSVEAQVVKYFGYQDSWEVNLVPAMIRWFPTDTPVVESWGFGLGWSYASEPPANEARREADGETTRQKWYWAFEVAFDTPRPDRDLILRLHHRSTGFGSIGEGRSTNALVLGLRQIF